MTSRQYYSQRGGGPGQPIVLDLEGIRPLFQTLFCKYEELGYLQFQLGYHCVDRGFVPGVLGLSIEGAMSVALQRDGLCPPQHRVLGYDEDDLFDVIEFIFDHCAKPLHWVDHDWNNCGRHCDRWDVKSGKAEFREQVNGLLRRYQSGYELSPDGNVLHLADSGLGPLLEEPVPDAAPQGVSKLLEAAQVKFRRHGASIEDRKDAVRDLAGVLELIRPRIKNVLMSKDEQDLFRIANNFGIRHHNERQQVNYDPAVWCTWMYYHYLATIHAALRLAER